MLFLLACLLGVLLWAWANRAALLEEAMRAYLAGRGVSEAAFTVEEAGLQGVAITGLRLGPAAAPMFTAARVEVTVTSLLGGLAGISGIEVVRPRLRLQINEQGAADMGALAPLVSGGGGGSGGLSLLPPLSVRGGRLVLATPQGELSATMDARMQVRDGRIEAVLSECARLQWPGMAAAGWRVESGGLEACPHEEGTPALVADAVLMGTAALSLPAFEVSLAQAGADGVSAEGTFPAIRATLRRSGSGIEVDWRAQGGSMRFAGFGIHVSDLDASGALSLSLAGGPLVETARLALNRADLADLARPARIAPMVLTGSGRLASGQADWQGVLRSADKLPGKVMSAQLSARHDMAGGRGAAVLRLDDVSFEPGRLDPDRLVPLLKGMVTRVDGKLAGQARFSWGGHGMQSDGSFVLKEVAFSTAAARFEGIEGEVALTSLLPPVTGTPQQLAIGLVSAGIELKNGTVEFSLAPSGAVQVHDASWPFADGRVALASGDIVPGAAAQRFTLDVDSVDLATLLEALAIEGASGTGTVSGQVPVEITKGDVLVTKGKLKAETPGVLSYKGSVAEAETGGQSDLVFRALRNFHYESLEMTLDGNALDRLTLGLFLEGANPDVYDGYPFKINIRTEAAFADLLQSGTVGFRAMDLIQEQGQTAP